MVENDLTCAERAPKHLLQSLSVSRYTNNVILSYHGLGMCCLQIGKIQNTAYFKIFPFKRYVPRNSVLGNKFSCNRRDFFFFISRIVCE